MNPTPPPTREELKRCPCCESPAQYAWDGVNPQGFVTCSNSDCYVRTYNGENAPVVVWNTRAREERLERALREIISHCQAVISPTVLTLSIVTAIADKALHPAADGVTK